MTDSIGELLRSWRTKRRLSQLELALLADMSARHISFVETGRTQPSRRSVLVLADRLEIPLRERNRLLLAAGFAPRFSERQLDDPDLAQARRAIQEVLNAHAPSPAVAVDRHWNVVLANETSRIFFDGVDPKLLEPPVNMMRIGLHPDGLAGRLINLGQVRAHWLPRLARQAARTGDPVLHELFAELESYGSPVPVEPPDPAAVGLTIVINYHDQTLRLLSTVTTFGATFDVTLDEIVMESYFPADHRTSVALKSITELDRQGPT